MQGNIFLVKDLCGPKLYPTVHMNENSIWEKEMAVCLILHM